MLMTVAFPHHSLLISSSPKISASILDSKQEVILQSAVLYNVADFVVGDTRAMERVIWFFIHTVSRECTSCSFTTSKFN